MITVNFLDLLCTLQVYLFTCNHVSKNLIFSEFFERVLKLRFLYLAFFLSHFIKLSIFENKIICLNVFVNMAFLFLVSRIMKALGKPARKKNTATT